MKKIFAANWKLQKSPADSRLFAKDFLSKTNPDFFKNKEIFIYPQNFSLEAMTTEFKGSGVRIGPQNIYSENVGAFTGENSSEVAKKMGAQTVLLGHSERRQFFSETNEALEKKIIIAQRTGLLPILCVGETLTQREQNQTDKICFEQLTLGLRSCDRSVRTIIAYEPVWAIGTGKVATPEQVRDIHQKIFQKLTDLGFKDFQILYGGSVKPENASELIQIPHVDGFLIGGASLEVDSFLKICACTDV